MMRGTFQKVATFPNLAEESGPNRPGQTFRLTIAYDGTDFFGWQIQPDRPTIQGAIATAVREIVGESVLPQGSGRTDTGVHAEGQVASLVLQAPIPADRLLTALNRRLPAAIRVMALRKVAADFHARASVQNKTYEYRIFDRTNKGTNDEQICPPALSRFAWDCRWPLRMERMQHVADALIGEHDFSSFAASDPDRTRRMADADEPVNNIRTLFSAMWRRSGDLLIFRVTGSGFLHHMVRNIVGTCVDAGSSRLNPDQVPQILAARDRSRAGATAPPQGLCLVNVVYRDDIAGGGCA